LSIPITILWQKVLPTAIPILLLKSIANTNTNTNTFVTILFTVLLFSNVFRSQLSIELIELASCLIYAQPFCPTTDDNSLIVCTSHDLTDDWSLASMHFVDSQYEFWCSFGCVSFIKPDVFDHNVLFDNTTPIYLINLPEKLGLGLGLDFKLHYFSIFHKE